LRHKTEKRLRWHEYENNITVLAVTNKKTATNITGEDGFKKEAWNGYKNKESVQIITRSRSDTKPNLLLRCDIYTQSCHKFCPKYIVT
jgi:hypothetical protein